MNRYSCVPVRKCRNLIASSRVRREEMVEKLDALWRELYRHATIEKDPQKLLQLTAEAEKRKSRAETIRQRHRL
jgi:hypothetical protein